MRILSTIEINGRFFPIERDMTPEEEAEYERMRADEEAARRQSPPTDMERLEAQMMYTAAMTDTLIEEA